MTSRASASARDRSDDSSERVGSTHSFEGGLRVSSARRAAVSMAAALVMLAGALLLVLPLGGLIDALSGRPPVALATFRLTPGTWIAGAVGIALLIPASGSVQRLVFGAPARSLRSVEGRFRWSWAARSLLLVAPVFLLVVVMASGAEAPRAWQASHIPLAVIALLITPLQSAGEEWLFRGLIGRTLAAPLRRRRVSLAVSMVGSSVLFWLGHGATEPFSVAYYLIVGVSLWLTAEWTGGLEAGSVMHACANTFLVVPAILAGGLEGTTALHGPVLLGPAAVWLVMPALLRVLARRTGTATISGR